MYLHHLQGILSFYFAKVTKIIKINLNKDKTPWRWCRCTETFRSAYEI